MIMINQKLFDDAIDVMREKDYSVTTIIEGGAYGTNMAKAPVFAITVPMRFPIKTCPKYWCGQTVRDPKINKKHITYTCKLVFSEKAPKTAEEIEEIINKRYSSLMTWALNLKEVYAKTKNPDMK